MKCKVRPHKLVEVSPGQLKPFSRGVAELIWDEDMYFPLKYQDEIMAELSKAGKSEILLQRDNSEYQKAVRYEQLSQIETRINNAIQIWKIKFGLTNVKPTMFTTDEKKCGILIGDPLFDKY